MIVIAFTGISDKLNIEQKAIIDEAVTGLKSGDVFYSGAATGVDIEAATIALQRFPQAVHRVIIPMWSPGPCPYDIDGVKDLRKAAERHDIDFALELGREGETKTDGYMNRNQMLALECTHMLAFPETKKEQRRSGTWATVRKARKLDKPVKVVPIGVS